MENQDVMQNESLSDKFRSIHWLVKVMIYAGLFSLLFGEFKNLAGAMLVLSIYSAYSLLRPSLKNRRVFYLILSVTSFISTFLIIAIGQLLD
jgi:hypothetical protein